jgi:hypothetical protein
VPLPAELLQAVSAEGGGKIALVVGAGCSHDAPTSLPLSKTLSEDAHQQLVLNGTLEEGECAEPSDLSKLADTVFAKTGSQAALVSVFPRGRLENADTNEGYDLAVALLREHAVADVMTLNFDLSAQHALAGAGAEVGVITGPNEMPSIGVVNLIHLHRDARADPEDWILRTEQIEVAWQDGWEQLIATRVMTAPVVIFAGLGTAAAVLVDTLKQSPTGLAALHCQSNRKRRASSPAHIYAPWIEQKGAEPNRDQEFRCCPWIQLFWLVGYQRPRPLAAP